MSKVHTHDELIKQARQYQEKRKAGNTGSITTSDEAVPEQDPNEQGTVSAPSHPDGDNKKKLQVPEGSRPTNTEEHEAGVETQNPGPTGTDPVGTRDGNSLDDAFTSPTTPLSKCSSEQLAAIAKNAAPILEKLAAKSKALGGNVPAQLPSLKPGEKTAGEKKKKGEGCATPEKAASEPGIIIPLTAADEAIGAAHVKISQALLSTERGMQLVENYMADMQGIEDARAMIEKAARDQTAFTKLASDVAKFQAQQEMIFAGEVIELDRLLKGASAEDFDRIIKLAVEHVKELSKLPPELHADYKGGAADATMIVEAAMAGGEMALPGGTGDLPPEQLAALIEQAAAEGKIDPQTAQMLLQALVGGGGEATPEGEGGGESESESEEGSEESKAAASDLNAELIAAVR